MKEFLDQSFWAEAYEKIATWTISNVPSIILILILFLIGSKLINLAINRTQKLIISRSKDDDDLETEKRVSTLMAIVKQAAKILLWVILIMVLLQKFGVDIGPLIASAGIIGLAVGFGAQELVRDFISGFFILLENHVRAGDVAIINGTGGLVERVELRTITLRDLSGVIHIFQNGKINTLSNMTKEWSAMVFDIGVAYKEDIDTVIKIMKEVGQDMLEDPDFKDNILEPLEVMGLDRFGDSALVIKARLKTKPIMQWSTGREYRKRLKIAFDKENIEIPFPHTTVYWGEEIDPLKLKVEDAGKAKK